MEHPLPTVREALADAAERVAGMGSYVWDTDTNEVIWSDNCYRLFGLEARSVVPSVALFMSFVHPDDRERVSENLTLVVESARTPPIEYRVVTPAGTRWMLCRAVAVRESEGQAVRLVGTFQDRTHIRERELALEAHAHVLEEAQRVAHLGSWVWRPAAGVFSWSPELYKITGQALDLVPTVETLEQLAHPDDQPLLTRIREQLVEDGRRVQVEVRIVRPDGQIRRVVLHVSAVDDPERWYLALLHDVTERRALEERLRRSQTMEAVGRLASGVAHDFNNLLTVIMASADMANFNRASSRELRDIVRAASTAAELSQRLLSMGQTSNSPLPDLDLDAAVCSATRMLAGAAGDNIDLRVAANSSVIIRGDRRQLDQALLNLVINARDAMDGSGSIVVRVVPARSGGAAIEVIDDGPGMGDEIRARALEPFFTTKGEGSGSGLGLAMVQGAVTIMGGEVCIDTAEGGGTRVTLWFPRSTGTPLPAPLSRPTPVVAGLRVLVVEDEPVVRSLCARMLRRAGMHVQVADGPVAAMSHMESALDVVLSDIAMPDGGGEAVKRAFTARRPELPLVFMSGYARRANWLGDRRVLSKPFLPDELVELLADSVRTRLSTP